SSTVQLVGHLTVAVPHLVVVVCLLVSDPSQIAAVIRRQVTHPLRAAVLDRHTLIPEHSDHSCRLRVLPDERRLGVKVDLDCRLRLTRSARDRKVIVVQVSDPLYLGLPLASNLSDNLVAENL